MRKVLISPGDRTGVGFLGQTVPLVALPVLGESLVNCWVESLANAKTKDLLILATDRPEVVRETVGDGSRWGVRIEVRGVLKELGPTEACAILKDEQESLLSESDVILMDHLPGLQSIPLFRSYQHWYNGLIAWMPLSASLNRIGRHEISPRVWGGRRLHLAPSAQIIPPCWIGEHVRIGPEAIIGPNTILEDRVVVDGAAEVQASVIGPDTFVGGLTKVENSLAWGSTLINWRTGSCIQVPDPFLLCSLGSRYSAGESRPQKPGNDSRPGLLTKLAKPWTLINQVQEKFRL